jgi:hypothetical protein
MVEKVFFLGIAKEEDNSNFLSRIGIGRWSKYSFLREQY